MIHHGPTEFRSDAGSTPELIRETLRRERDESRRQFASVLNSLSGLFYRCDVDAPWRMSFLSQGVAKLTGYTASELESQDGWSAIMRAEDKPPVQAAVRSAVEENRAFEVVYRIVRKTGETAWVSERGQAVYDEGGVPLFLEGVITDISGRREADELQRTMIQRWKRTLDVMPQMVWTMAGDGSDEFYNEQWFHFTGCRIGGSGGVSRAELIHEDDRARAMGLWDQSLEKGEPYEAQYRLKHVSGEYRWILSRGNVEKDSDGKAIRWHGTGTDIHEEVLGRQALQASEAINRSMIEASPDSISLLSTAGKIRFLNPAAVESLGLPSAASHIGRSWADAFPPALRSTAEASALQAASGGTGRFTATQAGADGPRWWDVVVAPIHDNGTALSGLISIARDITHQKTADERVHWAASHDSLTQLPNRALFQLTLDHLLEDATGSGAALTVLMLDLDDLKRTNDALGHDAGDALLTHFANCLRKAVRRDDLVARLGGDEFAVLLQGASTEEEVKAAVDAILACLKTPCEFDAKLLDIRTSIGASMFPRHGKTRVELLKHADIALYVAKRAGKGVLRTFRSSMRADAQKRTSMLGLARDAIREDRIIAHYQPKVELRTGGVDGFEALLRWTHPTKGPQLPETIGAAFQDGVLAAEISDRMIETVITDMRRWADAGVRFGHVAINAAAAEFRSGDFAEKLLSKLYRADLPTSLVQLEVTETVFLGRGAEHVEETLTLLSQAGVRIALDDFGTGYASLSHLNRFPVDVLKIDRSFISKLGISDHDAAIVRAVIQLGRSLGIKIVAEGIETEGQVNFLRKYRCQFGQGYLFGKAVSATTVPSLVANWGEQPLSA